MANATVKRKTNPTKGQTKRRKSSYRTYTTLLISLIAVVAALGCVFGYLAYEVYFHDGIYDGVSAAGVDLSGLSRREASSALERQMGSVMDNMDFSVLIDEESFPVNSADLGIRYSMDSAAAEAYQYGRTGSFFSRVGEVFRAKMSGHTVDFGYTYNLDAFDRVAREIADQINVSASGTSYEVVEDQLKLVVGSEERYIDPLTISQAMLDKVENNAAGDITLETGSGGRDSIDFVFIKSVIDREPEDAYLDDTTDPENPVVVPEVNGLSLDIAVAEAAIQQDGTGPDHNIYMIPLTVVEAEVKREDIVFYTYNDLISTAKTTLNKNNINRTDNIRLACEKIDGLILYPGDEFSFNKTVGERTYAAGFKDATIYLAGELADGVGGGICQVSSTLYIAAVGADLEITERKNHRYTVTYTELGEDATVAYDSKIDFRFVNNTAHAIKIHVVQESNYVLVELYGTLTDETRNKTVTMEHKVKSYTEYGTRYEISEDVEIGKTKEKNGGYSGYVVEVYRVVKENGEEVSRTKENTSTYTKLDKTILINPAEAETLDDGTVVYVPIKDEPQVPDVPTEPDEPDEDDPDDGSETPPWIPDPNEPDVPSVPDVPTEPDTPPADELPDWLL